MFALVTIAAAAVVATAHPPVVIDDTISADSIIARYYAAVGGKDKLLAIQSRRLTGTYRQGSLAAHTVILWRRPGVRRIVITAPGINHAEGFDGVTWEHDYATGRTIRDTGTANVMGRRSAEFDESFVDYATKRSRVTSLGSGLLDGQPTYGLRVALMDGAQKDYFFDQKSGLIVAVKQQKPMPGGKSVETLTSYDDWRPVGGVLMPHVFLERNTVNGGIINRVEWDTIEVNVPTSVSDFRPPTGVARSGAGTR